MEYTYSFFDTTPPGREVLRSSSNSVRFVMARVNNQASVVLSNKAAPHNFLAHQLIRALGEGAMFVGAGKVDIEQRTIRYDSSSCSEDPDFNTDRPSDDVEADVHLQGLRRLFGWTE